MANTTIRHVTAWAMVPPPNVAVVRSISGFALQSVPRRAALRNIGGYALVKVLNQTYFSLLGPSALLTAINKEQSLSLKAADLTFADPAVLSNDAGYNTNVKLTANPSAPYQGSMTVRYNRYNLSAAFDGKGSALPSDTATTIAGRLTAINQQFGTNLQARDIVDGAVAANATTLTLRIAATSYLYVPGSTMVLGS